MLSETANDGELYGLFKQLLQEDGHINSKSAFSLFDFSLALHSSAPRIEAHYQYYNTSVEPTVTAAQDAACPVWAHYEGMQYCSPALERAQQDGPAIENMKVLPFDRVLGDPDAPPIVLYADILSPQFREFHQELSQRARDGDVSYRLRYRPSPHGFNQPLMMNGYGVELNLKRTDYIVIDDRATEQGDRKSEDEKASTDSDDIQPLSASELSQLGLRAASFVLNDKSPFDALVNLAQDFPRLSNALADHDISESFILELEQNRQKLLRPGLNQIWLNGLPLDDQDDVDAFHLLEHIRREQALVKGLQDHGFTGKEAVDVIANALATSSGPGDDVLRYDYRDDLEDNQVIIWLNDLENDDRYAKWPSSVMALLRATYPGQLPAVRREIHNVVIPVNLTDVDDVRMVTSTIRMFIDKRIPSRFGLVPSLSREDSVPMVKVAHYIAGTFGPMALLDFLEQSMGKGKLSAPSESILIAVVGELQPSEDKQPLQLHEILNGDRYNSYIENTRSYFRRLAIETAKDGAIFFANGVSMIRDETFLPSMATRLSQDLNMMRQLVFQEVYDETSWLPSYYLEHALLGRNPVVAPEDGATMKVIDMNDIFKAHSLILGSIAKIPASRDSTIREWASVILVADLDSAKGQEQLQHLIQFQEINPGLEISLLHSVQSIGDISSQLVQKGDLSSTFVTSVLSTSGNTSPLPQEADEDSWLLTKALLKSVDLSAGDTALIYNGRLVGPLSSSTILNPSDLNILQHFERSRRITRAVDTLEALDLLDRIADPAHLARTTSHLALAAEDTSTQAVFDTAPPARSSIFNQWSGENSSIVVSKTDDPIIFINAVVDPASEMAQRYLPILKVLANLEGVQVHILLDPHDDLQELPVKRFYRHVLTSTPSFDDDGHLSIPKAEFKDIPKKALLTLAMDVPQAWLVAPEDSVHDLDNLLLSNVKEGSNVDALYLLEYILVEGHSRDTTLNVPPRGVQLLLGTETQPHYMDTIIMANLGYFQFKSRPGYWKISLKPGPSESIFSLDDIGANVMQTGPDEEKNHLTLMSFQGKILFPRLSRRKGHEKDDVLSSSPSLSSARGYLSRGLDFASSLFSGPRPQTKVNADINIFSVASGHLYERMLNIMMVSVMRHTEHTVKF
ncbi:hypothetical protein KEM56_004077, partial [Ascosphaera pollenicola]